MSVGNSDGQVSGHGGARFWTFISESGLYALVFKSRKPEAKAFRKWVTQDVLPAIRKTGRFDYRQIPDFPVFAGGAEEDRDLEMLSIVHATATGLFRGTVPLARAQVVFTGAKVYHLLRSGSRDAAGDLALAGRPTNPEAEQLLIALADRLDEDGDYSSSDIQMVAKSARLFPDVDGDTAPMILGRALASSLGRLLRDSRGRVFTARSHRTATARRYAIEFEKR